MPTVLSHALVGAALSRFGPRGAGAARLAALCALLAALPDADVLGLYLGVPYAHPLGHRGFSHSLLFATLAGPAAVTLGLRQLPRGSRAWWSASALASLACASHGLLDALTDAGLGVAFWLPFSGERHFLPWRPLATSPLSPAAILSGRLLPVLASELSWIGPGLLALLAFAALRRRRREPRPG